MAKRPYQPEGNPFDEDEATNAAAAPLADRTRMEVSPFAEPPAAPDRTRIQASPFAQEAPEPAPRPARRPTRSSASVQIDESSGLQTERSRRGRPSGSRPAARPAPQPEPPPEVEEDWEAPEGEYAEATRVGLPPTSRPPRREAAQLEEEEDWGPPPPVDEANATRIASVPRERPGRAAPDPEDGNATHAGPPMTVEVVEGPDLGMRLPMRGGRMVVGRGDGCDYRLKDAAASRRHAELVMAASGLVVRDLGSGNGTRVNGEKVTEAVVNHGDRIAVGQTVLLVVDDLKKFEEERAALARPAPARPAPRSVPPRRMSAPNVPPPRRAALDDGPGTSEFVLPRRRGGGGPLERFRELGRPVQLGILGGGGLVLLLLVAMLAKAANKPPPPPPGPSPQEIEYDSLFEAGKRFLRDGDPDRALEKFQSAQAIFDKAELSRYIEACDREAKGKRLLVKGQSLAADGDFAAAIEVLKSVDNLSASYDEAKKLAEDYEKQRIAGVKAKIQALIEEEDLDSARLLLDKLPHEDAVIAGRSIETAEREFATNAVLRAKRARERAAREKKAALRRARAEVDQAIAGVVRKIDSGNFDGADRELDRVIEAATSRHVVAKVQELRKLIPRFAAVYREGISKYNGGAYEQAAQPLLRALTLYEDMDIAGKLGDSLQDKVGKSMEMRGRAAMARQEYGTAAKSFREALRFNPKSSESKVALADISRRAKEVYLEGYVEMGRNPDLARKKFRQVLDMVGSENEAYQDAKRRLSELDSK